MSLEIIEERDVLRSVKDVLNAYDASVIEFIRDDALVFADEKMCATKLTEQQVMSALEEAKRAYSEVYR